MLACVQAGARKVYAVEASGMARWARQLADGNPSLGSRIVVVNSKVEEADIPEKVGGRWGSSLWPWSAGVVGGGRAGKDRLGSRACSCMEDAR